MSIDLERRTINAMIRIFCKGLHHSKEYICRDCSLLNEYALKKTDNCIFKEKKPACSKCKVHCFSQVNREKIREVMKFSGKRMLIKHPYLSIAHLLKTLY